jgi:hypothetical protein
MQTEQEMKKPAAPAKPFAPSAPEYDKAPAPGFGFNPAQSVNDLRQGVTGHGVRFVLALGMLGAAMAFLWLIYWVY